MSLHAVIAHSPDDISGFATLTGDDAIAGVTLPFTVVIDGVGYTTATDRDQRSPPVRHD